MEGISLSKDQNGQQTCQLCNASPRRYTCPRCEVAYCSMECYKSAIHSECSESFYKECVQDELKLQDQDPEGRRKMIDILKRMRNEDMELQDSFYEESVDDEDSAHFMDSDDEDDVPDLEERLKGVNLDNADELWNALTNTEKQEFEATLRNGNATDFLPQYIPWWSNTLNRKIIEEIVDDKAEPEYAAKCPKIVQIPMLNELTKASPFVRFNLLNVLHAYAYTVLHSNGDHQNSALDSVKVFLRLSDNMLHNKVYEDSRLATEAVAQKITDCPSLLGGKEARAAVEEAVNLIINGPDNSNPAFFVTAALSDLYHLFANARKEFSQSESSRDRNFSTKFDTDDAVPVLTKKIFLLCTKKLEYYLAWIKKNEMRVDD